MINIIFFTGEEILSSSNQRKIAEQAKFSYSPLGKAFEKTNRKSGWCFKISRSSSKKGNLKQIECTFAQDLMNDLIRVKLKQIVEMQNVIKKRWFKL